jgi:WD40 repeat protein
MATLRELRAPGSERYGTMDLALSHDGTVALTTVGKDALVWDLRDPNKTSFRTLGTHRDLITGVALPQGPGPCTIALTAGHEGWACLWDLATCRVLRRLPVRPDHWIEVALAEPARRRAATACRVWIRLWDTATGALVVEMQYWRGEIMRIALAPDASKLVTAGYVDGLVMVWDLGAPEPPARVVHQTGGDTGLRVEMNSEGALLLGDAWRPTLLWRDLGSTEPPQRLLYPPTPDLGDVGARCVAITPDWCAVGGMRNQSVALFSTRTGTLMGQSPAWSATPYGATVTGVALPAGDPRTMVTTHIDGALRVWRLWGQLGEAALATLGSPTWRRLWWSDGDHALWARVLSFENPF